MKKNEFLSCHVIKENTSLVGPPEPNVIKLLVDAVLVSIMIKVFFKQAPKAFYKKGVLRNFTKLIGKHLY